MSSKRKTGKANTARKPKTAKTTKVAAAPVDGTPKRGRGRPSEYKPEYAEQITKLYLLGCTDEEVSDFFRVSKQTLYNWRQANPELLDSVKAKLVADAEVAASAHKKATGYDYKMDKIVGRGDNAKVVTLIVHVPGDSTAQQFWLRNRHRRNWADTKQVEVGGPGEFDAMSPDELITYIRQQEEAIGLYDAEPGSDAVN